MASTKSTPPRSLAIAQNAARQWELEAQALRAELEQANAERRAQAAHIQRLQSAEGAYEQHVIQIAIDWAESWDTSAAGGEPPEDLPAEQALYRAVKAMREAGTLNRRTYDDEQKDPSWTAPS